MSETIDYTKGVDPFALMMEVDTTLPRDLKLKPLMPEDNVVGVVSSYLRRFWLVCLDIEAEAKSLIAQVKNLDEAHVVFHKEKRCNRRGCLGLVKQLERTKEQALAAEHIATHAMCAFWSLATVELCIQDNDQEVALREGYVVITTDDVEEEEPRPVGAWLSGLTIS